MDVLTSPFPQPQKFHILMPFIQRFKFTNTSSSHPLSSLLFTSRLEIIIPSFPRCPNLPFSFPNYMYLPVPASCPKLSADILVLLIQVCHHSGFHQKTAPPRCALTRNQQPSPPPHFHSTRGLFLQTLSLKADCASSFSSTTQGHLTWTLSIPSTSLILKINFP